MARNRILVVEDDEAIAKVIQKNLASAGYAVSVCYDGDSAATLIHNDSDFDLALLDVMLPGMDGFELLPYLKHDDIPVIFLTAKADLDSKLQGLRGGAEDYIVKPFEVLELLVRIEKVLERTGKLDKVLRVRDITIDLESHTVTKGGARVELKPLEFDVLVMLARYKNRTLLREKILNEIWGADFFGDTHTVDVHIANLRKKLGLSDAIKTVPKYGYRLED